MGLSRFLWTWQDYGRPWVAQVATARQVPWWCTLAQDSSIFSMYAIGQILNSLNFPTTAARSTLEWPFESWAQVPSIGPMTDVARRVEGG